MTRSPMRLLSLIDDYRTKRRTSWEVIPGRWLVQMDLYLAWNPMEALSPQELFLLRDLSQAELVRRGLTSVHHRNGRIS